MGFLLLWCSALDRYVLTRFVLACISLAEVAEIGTTVPAKLGNSGTAMTEQLVIRHITSSVRYSDW